MPIRYSALIEDKGIKKIGLSKAEISAAYYKPDKKEEVVTRSTRKMAITLFTKKGESSYGEYILLGISEHEKSGPFIYFAVKVPLYVHPDPYNAAPSELLKAFGSYFGTEVKVGNTVQKVFLNQNAPIEEGRDDPRRHISVPIKNLHEMLSLEIFTEGDTGYDRVLLCLLVMTIDFTIYLPKVGSYFSKGVHTITLTNKETGFVNKHQIHTPTLFRYLPLEYVNRFFKDGSIRLSSFSAFRKHLNEQQLDLSEGIFTHVHRTTQGGGQTIMADWAFGLDAYSLCATVNYSKEVQKAFGCDSYIKINNSAAFASEIATVIPDYKMSIEGPCIYQTKKMIVEDLGYIDIEEFKNEKGELDENRFMASMQRHASRYGFFLKLKSFSHQNEYRFGWVVKGAPQDYIDLKVPGAIKYCSLPSPFDE